jgi:(p)ppGpp synthase/HD superfamily hydrolase
MREPNQVPGGGMRELNRVPGEQLAAMLSLAANRHHGQFDKGGRPYILHPLKVMHYTNSDDEEIQCIALGHGLIEYTYSNMAAGVAALRKLGFSTRVILGIVLLTKRPDQTYEKYKECVKTNLDAVIVKMADLTHNSDIRRLKGATDRGFERVKRYQQFYLELSEILKNHERSNANEQSIY